VHSLLALPVPNAQDGEVFMPEAPNLQPRLSATVLANHPAVLAAAREVDAARADIAVARADRLPRLNLTALLTGQWLSAAGTTLHVTTWSLGPALSANLFDGGAGAANVSAAEARWHGARAALQAALRNAARDTENALAAAASAEARMAPARQSVEAARKVLAALHAQWQAGAVSLFELEDARRQYASAQDNAIAAERDRALAWVALVRASGQASSTYTLSFESTEPHEERRLFSSR